MSTSRLQMLPNTSSHSLTSHNFNPREIGESSLSLTLSLEWTPHRPSPIDSSNLSPTSFNHLHSPSHSPLRVLYELTLPLHPTPSSHLPNASSHQTSSSPHRHHRHLHLSTLSSKHILIASPCIPSHSHHSLSLPSPNHFQTHPLHSMLPRLSLPPNALPRFSPHSITHPSYLNL